VSRYSVNFLQFQFFCQGQGLPCESGTREDLRMLRSVRALLVARRAVEQPVNLAENRVTQHHIPVPHLLHQMLILGCRMRGWLLSYVAIQLIELKLISLNWM
jgi:hypothetical protein